MSPCPRSLFALVLLAILASFAAPARASTTATGIEIDGNQVDEPAAAEEDWFPTHAPSRDPFASDDTTLCGTSPAPKNDIVTYFLANDDDFLFIGMERLTNNGNTSFFFSFDITGDGPSVGDFIFVFCFGSGTVVTDTYVLEWDPALGDWVRDATPPVVDFAVNTSPIAAPFGTIDERGRPAASLDPGRFAEARIRLADIEGFDPCEADDVTGVMDSKSSCSLSSECKDTTGPFHFSFDPLTADVQLAQPPDCEATILATAHVTSPRAPAAYQWFLNGDDITGRDPSYATSDSIAIVLADECGPTEVKVVVTDGTCSVEDVATIEVGRKPVAAITNATVGACDQNMAYDASASSSCNGAALVYLWDFESDGVVDSTAQSGTWGYGGCGDRLVTLRVGANGCLSDPVFVPVHVNAPPVAVLQVVPDACLAVDFTSLSGDCDLLVPPSSGPEALSQVLDWGDGSPPDTGTTGRHEYAACATYSLTLTVTDLAGCSSVDSRRVTFTGVLDVR